jgi:hypothetical protein
MDRRYRGVWVARNVANCSYRLEAVDGSDAAGAKAWITATRTTVVPRGRTTQRVGHTTQWIGRTTQRIGRTTQRVGRWVVS